MTNVNHIFICLFVMILLGTYESQIQSGFTQQRAMICDLNKVIIWPGGVYQENNKTVHLAGSVGEDSTGY